MKLLKDDPFIHYLPWQAFQMRSASSYGEGTGSGCVKVAIDLPLGVSLYRNADENL